MKKVLIILLVISCWSCEKGIFSPLPDVVTLPPAILNASLVTLYGEVTDEGRSAVTSRGFCWALTSDPTVNDNYSQNEFGLGEYSEDLHVIPDTTYYFKAFAKNDKGTAYGNQISFSTPVMLPDITSAAITNISCTNAITGGIVNSDGGATVTARGVCWNLTGNPTISDNSTFNGSGNGAFTSSITGLSENTKYYVRAYATNSKGTSYGYEESFFTLESAGSLIDSRDSYSYKWITIGTQMWMVENLAYLPSVSSSYDGSYSDPYYYVYGYEGTSVSSAKATDNYTTYGVIYNWEAAKIACPTGWHLPSDDEWKILEKHLGMSHSDADDIGARYSGDVGKKLKSTSGWIHNGNGNNSSGFNVLPGGYRTDAGGFGLLGYGGNFWSSTEDAWSNAWFRNLDYYDHAVARNGNHRRYNLSVRCLKN